MLLILVAVAANSAGRQPLESVLVLAGDVLESTAFDSPRRLGLS